MVFAVQWRFVRPVIVFVSVARCDASNSTTGTTDSPTPENPLGIVPAAKRSDNYFLLIGDWGAPTDTYSSGGCQRKIASMMKDYVNRLKAQGKKCLFVGSVGDNFYDSGLKDAHHWETQWANVYGTTDPSSALYDIPWLAVLGNHDIGDDDPTCACGHCRQFNNGEGRPSWTRKFWMPDYYWHYFIPGVDLEIIGLDTNAVDVDGLSEGRAGCTKCDAVCGGRDGVTNFLTRKMNDGLSYLENRARSTRAKTALIMQHYNPDDPIFPYKENGKTVKARFDRFNGGRTKSLSAYGHTHDQLCQGSRRHGCDTILTGGGAGHTGGKYFGFVSVHLDDTDGHWTNMEASEFRIAQGSCQYMDDDPPGVSSENFTLSAVSTYV